MTNFAHGGNCGDIIWHLPVIRALGGGNLFLRLGQPGRYIGPHPLGNVRLNQDFAEKLGTLLRGQDYLHEVAVWQGQEIDIDLDRFRETGFPLIAGNIARWPCFAFPCCPDLATPWLRVTPSTRFQDCILVNRTRRYHNRALHYRFLNERPDVFFVGLPEEYQEFNRQAPAVPGVTAVDFLQLAEWIAGCRLFIGNQSVAFALAEALGVPRVLEVCLVCPNVIPAVAGNGFEVMTQQHLEALVARLAAPAVPQNR